MPQAHTESHLQNSSFTRAEAREEIVRSLRKLGIHRAIERIECLSVAAEITKNGGAILAHRCFETEGLAHRPKRDFDRLATDSECGRNFVG